MRLLLLFILPVCLFGQLSPGAAFYFAPDKLQLNANNDYGQTTDSGFVVGLKSIGSSITATQTINNHRPIITSTATIGTKKIRSMYLNVNDGLLLNDHTLTKNLSGVTLYAVLKCLDVNPNNNYYQEIVFLDANGDRSRISLTVDYISGCYLGKGRRTDAEWSASSAYTYGKHCLQGDVIVCFRMDYSTGTASFFTNGILTSSAVITSTGTSSNTNGLHDAIGNDFATAPTNYYGFKGYIGRLALYQTAQSDALIAYNSKELDKIYGIYNQYKANYTYDAETTSLLSTFTTQPTEARKDLINDFYVGLKSDLGIPTISTVFDFLFVTAAHNQQAANVNWAAANRHYSITPTGSPTWATTGYTGATNKYLRFGLTPSTSTLNCNFLYGEFGCWLRNNISEQTAAMGVQTGASSNRTILWPKWSDNVLYIYPNNCTYTGTTVSTSAGLTLCQYGVLTTTGGTSQLSTLYYKNSTKVFEGLYNCSSTSALELYGMANNNAGSATQFSTNEASLFFYKRPGYVTPFYNRLNTLLTGLGGN